MQAEELYLDLLKKCLTRYLFEGEGYRAVARRLAACEQGWPRR
jgi:hypothetical protein